MAELLYGAPVVQDIVARAASRASDLAASGISAHLSMVRVGDNPDDMAYMRGALKRSQEVGVTTDCIQFPDDITTEALIAEIMRLNEDAAVSGILLFRPLPKSLDEERVCAAIAPEKDVDAATEASLFGALSGKTRGFYPCTPSAVLEMLRYYGIEVAGRKVCVVGRSLVVGRPLAAMLLSRNATVTVAHSKSVDLPLITRNADIVICAIGKAKFFTADYFVPGQTVIDVGINWDAAANKLVGDCAFDEVSAVVSALTPVPGGVGALTSAVLAEHVVSAACAIKER